MGRHSHRSSVLYLICILAIACMLSNAYATNSETRSIKTFDSIKVSGPVILHLSEGSSDSVKISVEDDDPDKIITEVEGKKLEIKPKTSSFIESGVKFDVYVTYETLRGLRSGNKAEVQGESVIKGDKLDVEVLNGSTMNIQIDVNTLSCNVTGTGELTVSGKTVDLKSEVNTKGVLHAFDLDCENAYVKLGTGGIAEIYATELIEGSVKTASKLTFKGDTKKQRVEKSTGGRIKEL